jgi:outer membrane protein OmpA-like peptidoglycan-associated protein
LNADGLPYLRFSADSACSLPDLNIPATKRSGLAMNKNMGFLTALVVASSALVGCAQMTETQRTTGTGAAIGAVAGAVIGQAAGGNRKSTATGAALGAVVGAGGGYLWSQRMQEQKATMEQATQGTGINVSQTADNQLKLEIPSDISFDSGRYDIKPRLRPILDRFAVTLNQNTASTVNIIGHTDSTGTDAVNMPLSVNRAAATRDYLVARGVAANRISIDGRGSREPLADNGTADGRAMNRRVEIFVAEAAR